MRRGVGTAVKTTKMPLLTKNSRRARWDKIFSGEPCTGGACAPLCLCSNNKILWPEGRSFVRSCIFWSLAAMRLAARRWRVDWIGHTCRGEWKDQNTCLDSGLSEGCLCEDDPKKHRKCALYVCKVEDAGFLGQTICSLWQNFLSAKHSIFSTAGALVVITV